MLAIRRFLILPAAWLAISAAAAGASTSAPSSNAPPYPQLNRLRRITDAEFLNSLTNAEVRTDAGVVLSHGHSETFLPGRRYGAASGPLRSFGTYQLRGGVVCARTDAEPRIQRCRVILTDGAGRFFSRPARSIDDQTGHGPIAELRIERPNPPAAPQADRRASP